MLPAGGRTFVRRILETLRDAGVPDAVVVVRPGQDDVIAEIAAAGFGRVVPNLRAHDGQLSSLIVGLDAVDAAGVVAALVTLVDVPLLHALTVRRLCDRAATSSASILRAVHHGRHGHPVIFKRALFEALRHADPALGAKAVMHATSVEDVEVEDPNIADDIDTPADYARIFGPGEGGG